MVSGSGDSLERFTAETNIQERVFSKFGGENDINHDVYERFIDTVIQSSEKEPIGEGGIPKQTNIS